MTVLGKLLSAGNEVLIVSKPHLDCIRAICNAFERYRDIFELVDDHYRYRMVFRFTIGACDDRILSFWEPNAPVYEERKTALKYAFETGFQTSVSAEPMLDAQNIDLLVLDLMPYITDSFWIGEMNHIGRFSKYAGSLFQRELNRIRAGQTPTALRNIYNRFRSNPKIKWKNGIKKIVGLQMATVPGLDI
jgi:DNA repair photolyase